MKHGPCQRVGCERPAEYYPVLSLRPKKYKGKAARACIKLGLCEACAKTKNPDEFLTEPGWRMLLAGFAKLKLQRPHRSSITVEFMYIDAEEWKRQCVFILGAAEPKIAAVG